ncbi:MAG TPA: hypothetical protein VF637_04845 [Sphingomicrobium sp.]
MSTRAELDRSFPWVPIVAALMISAPCWFIPTTDIKGSYIPWLDHIATHGPAAFSKPFGDYSPPYYYLLALLSSARGMIPDMAIIKLAAVLSTGVLALAVWRLLESFGVAQAKRFAAYMLLLPSIALNATLTGSCDALWAAAAVMGLVMALSHRHAAMLIWCGIAFAIKAQAIFAGPAILALLISRRVPMHLWLLMPAAMFAMYVPAWALGWPLADLMTLYFRQAEVFHYLSLNAPNVWAPVQLFVDPRSAAAEKFATAVALAATLGLVLMLMRKRIEGATLLAATCLSVLIVAGLLPRMHERYFYLVDVLAYAFAAISRTRGSWIAAALVQTGSTLAFAAYATNTPILAVIGALPMMATLVYFARICAAAPGRVEPLEAIPGGRLAPG